MGKETVTVACKLPNGLRLRIFKMITVQEPVLGGGVRDVERAEALPEVVHIRGYHFEHVAKQLKSKRKPPPIAAQEPEYMFTPGVDAEFMRIWMEQNAGSALVKNRIILVHGGGDTRGLARENEKRRTGMEPLDPDNLPKSVQGIETMKREAA